MEMGDDRIEFAQIRALYDGERYPLIRKDLQPRDLATASVQCHRGASPPHGGERSGR